MWSFRCKFVDKTLMHFSYSPSVQKCVSMKFIFNKIHYVNLWHFCPLHLQALIDSTWKLWRGPRGSRDAARGSRGTGHVTRPAGHVTPGHCSHVPQARRLTHPKTRSTSPLESTEMCQKTPLAWSSEMSGLAMTGQSVFPAVSAHQSFRVHVRRRKGKTTLVCYFGESDHRQQEEMPDRPLQPLTKMS